MDPPACPNCPSRVPVDASQGAILWPESGLTRLFLHGARQYTCRRCRGETVHIPHVGPLCRALARKLIWQVPRLLPEHLTFLRQTVDWVGQELAAELHVPPPILSRWLHEPRAEALHQIFPAATEVLFRLLIAQRALGPGDVWGLMGQRALSQVASAPPAADAWMRATLLPREAGQEVFGEGDASHFWRVEDATSQREAKEGSRPDTLPAEAAESA